MKSKENRFRRKKVKKKAYSITTQQSKVVFGIFDDKKVKNIDIEYRSQSIFSHHCPCDYCRNRNRNFLV